MFRHNLLFSHPPPSANPVFSEANDDAPLNVRNSNIGIRTLGRVSDCKEGAPNPAFEIPEADKAGAETRPTVSKSIRACYRLAPIQSPRLTVTVRIAFNTRPLKISPAFT